MTEAVRHLVRQRAKHRCEYCQLHQDDSPLAALHIEHIRPIKHGGTDAVENSLPGLHRLQSAQRNQPDRHRPGDREITPLFHPRRDNWDEHFGWNGTLIAGRTAVGRATIRELDLNGDDHLDLRLG